MVIPEKIVCDFCKDKNARLKHYEIPVITNCNWTDGYPESEHVNFMNFDICDECLAKIANVRCGFQGSNPTIISCEGERN